MIESQRMAIYQYIDQHRDEMIRDLAALIRIPSVKSAPQEGAPFGPECARALQHTLARAQEMGFATNNLDNYIGYADMGQGDTLFGILAHLDVVPEGDGWQHPCFGAEIQDGKMYGRGTLDDKGPALSSLYAMAAIQAAGIPLRRRVRLLLGTDEESGWGDIDHYREQDVLPDMAISPDGEYPLVNVEMGILGGQIEGEWNHPQTGVRLLSIAGGTRPNVVPGSASALLSGLSAAEVESKAAALCTQTGILFEISQQDEAVAVRAIGQGAHASRPETGRNAICGLLQLLAALPFGADAGGTVLQSLARCFPVQGHDGAAAGIAMRDQISRALTCNLGLIQGGEGRLVATLDLRIPVTASPERIIHLLGLHTGLRATQLSFTAPHVVPENSELVQTLLRVYAQETGKEAYCMAIGGGTYARAIENAVTFGCLFPGEKDTMHQPEEAVLLDHYILNAKILAVAIAQLCGA